MNKEKPKKQTFAEKKAIKDQLEAENRKQELERGPNEALRQAIKKMPR